MRGARLLARQLFQHQLNGGGGQLITLLPATGKARRVSGTVVSGSMLTIERSSGNAPAQTRGGVQHHQRQRGVGGEDRGDGDLGGTRNAAKRVTCASGTCPLVIGQVEMLHVHRQAIEQDARLGKRLGVAFQLILDRQRGLAVGSSPVAERCW